MVGGQSVGVYQSVSVGQVSGNRFSLVRGYSGMHGYSGTVAQGGMGTGTVGDTA